MSIHDLIIENQPAPSFRQDVQAALQATGSNFMSATAPTTTYAGQLWIDITAAKVKIRNSSNNAWVTLGDFADKMGRVHVDANPGLLKFPGTGVNLLTIQWGSTVVGTLSGAGGGNVTFTQPMSGVFTVIAINGDPSANASLIAVQQPFSTVNFGFVTLPATPGGSIRVNWLAIGYS